MLRQRVITAAILIPLVVFVILKAEPFIIAIVSAGLFLLGAWEWTRIVGITNRLGRLTILLIYVVLATLSMKIDINTVLITSAIWWLLGSFLVAFFPRGKVVLSLPLIGTIAGALTLVPAWISLIWLHTHIANGPILLLFTLVLIWGADSGAYFFGKYFGRHKLAPNVSPGKTWQGVFGAFVTTLIIAYFTYEKLGTYINFHYNLWLFLAISFVTVCFSVVGDLIESLFKRISGVKDSGTIFPGHGGVMDRIDSLTAALPLFLGSYLFLTAVIP